MNDPSAGDLQARLERIAALCRRWTNDNADRAVAVYVTQGKHILMDSGFGAMHPLSDAGTSRATHPDTIFLVASLTKPLTAAAICLLVDRGQVLLDDPLSDYIPTFVGGERQALRLRHLLTHTSGLPDMLAENVALRVAHAPLSEFVDRTCTTPLLFLPGTDCRYQSMGILLAAAVVERVTGVSLPQFLASEFFQPLGMRDSCLGLGLLDQGRTARVILQPDDAQTSWNWNSAYWRGLGAPWGGLHTTARDYARFLQFMLAGGLWQGQPILSAAMVRCMLGNQLAGMAGVPGQVKLEQAWGLGWRLNQPAGTHGLPEIASARTFGHGGATGTTAWADPDSGLACVTLTNDPESGRLRSCLSNLVAGLAALPLDEAHTAAPHGG